jgi:ABC-type branched-subunit amino acid transport system substrate-binding protein
MKKQQFCKVSRNKILLLGVTVILLIGGYGSSLAAEAPQTIKIGCSIPLTGPFGIGGGWVKQGYDLAVKHINSDGGIYIEKFKKKIPLEILYVDSESDPVKSTRRMDKLYPPVA